MKGHDQSATVRGRYAPSPTGLTHLGNALSALLAWLSVRSKGGLFVWRLEDIDKARCLPGMADSALEDLAWLGLDWDEGGSLGGPHAPYDQGSRSAVYERALQRLAAKNAVFPCRRSRRDLLGLASAPHAGSGLPPYPIHFRPEALAGDWYEQLLAHKADPAAIRLKVNATPVTYHDILSGPKTENLLESVGDFVLKRRDGFYAYQLAVVVDDIDMNINEVVRGRDLLDSTARQVFLTESLGGTVPSYAHVPLLLAADGQKLSKRDEPLALRSLREAGLSAAQVVGWLAASCGLIDKARAIPAKQLIECFAWSRIRNEDQTVPPNVVEEMRSLRDAP